MTLRLLDRLQSALSLSRFLRLMTDTGSHTRFPNASPAVVR